MAPPIPKLVSLVLLTMVVDVMRVGATTWCVARFDVTDQALKGPLKQACGSGADCGPIQPGGSCFNPNTTRNHASYAFNSYYQRKNRAPGTCFFRHTAMIALSDPSYGTCVYPTSPRTSAREANSSTTTPALNNPNVSS